MPLLRAVRIACRVLLESRSSLKSSLYLLGGIEDMRVQVILECTETKLRHYVTTKNKKTHPERLEMRKYNPVLKRHSLYREVK